MRPLHEMVTGYPADHPIQDERDLVQLTRQDIDHPVVLEMWERLHRAANALTGPAGVVLTTADTTYRALADSSLVIDPTRTWTVFVLTHELTPRYTISESGRAYVLKSSHEYVPYPRELPRARPGDQYLIIGRGTPRMLNHPKVQERLRELVRDVPALDVCLWHRPRVPASTTDGTLTPVSAPSFWSLRAGTGRTDRSELPITEDEATLAWLSELKEEASWLTLT